MHMSKWRKYIFPAVFGLVIYTSLRLVNDVISDTNILLRPWHVNVIEIVGSILMGYLTMCVIHRFFRYQQQRIENNNAMPPAKEFLLLALILELLISVTMIPLCALTDDGLQWYDVVNIYLLPLLFNLIYYGYIRGNALVQKSYEQQIHIEQLAKNQLQSELRFLKAQYHPHFLFNALNTIYFQMDESVPKAKHTVEKLSELLRYQLYDQQQKVSIAQEIHYLQSYIQLQKERMNEHLDLRIAFDPQLNEQKIFPLLLLPLVENAFKYCGGDYWIDINATLQDGYLHFIVQNAVPGTQQPQSAGGIGLESLKRSLTLQYPQQHTLDIHRENNVFSVAVKILLCN
ncbi:histidine kinase [Chitinophaga skermanii]|uniref:Histidine kinase n=1 Tax=Chitinophaga skermanii TaxID=331697 RepID=A0A327QJ74_9BACT|nr:histidine kinase [Chitinophaga skermanii]RAJ04045.1 histidine kinase [Chitinophaga skermanii]